MGITSLLRMPSAMSALTDRVPRVAGLRLAVLSLSAVVILAILSPSMDARIRELHGDPPAYFTGVFSDVGVDRNANGLFDYLRVTAQVIVTQLSSDPGGYWVLANVYAGMESSFVHPEWARTAQRLGSQTMEFLFSGPEIRQTGNSTRWPVFLTITTGAGGASDGILDQANYTTAASYDCQAFDAAPGSLGSMSDYKTSTDLVVNVAVVSASSDFHQLEGSLYGTNASNASVRHFINVASQSGRFGPGSQVWQFAYNLSAVQGMGLVAPYRILFQLVDRNYYLEATTWYTVSSQL